MSKEKPDDETLQKWHDDPNNWKWGMFYFNREDKRIFPPKRNESMGYTINFANPLSILICVGLALLILTIWFI
ncbi:MAG: DUF5808 domain-containing protein [Bacteroidetes bacterium]|nr:DUF5808 domain-containing protein [Bacteroidota bacterium]